jgi:DNA (cytosine-5)-methyltransferase 1
MNKKRQFLKIYHFMKSNHSFTFADLFSGIGGCRLALTLSGGHCIYSSEIDRDAQIAYEYNFDERPSGDITLVDAADVPAHDLLCAGFPCPSFSLAGKRKGFADPRGTLFFEVARIVEYHRPPVVLLENVKNLVTHDGGKTMAVMVDTLEHLGYNVFWNVLNASHYGAPTRRERVYFVCFRKDCGISEFYFPVPTHELVTLGDSLDNRVPERYEIKRDDINIGLTPPPNERYSRPVMIGVVGKGRQGYRVYSTAGQAVTFTSHGGGVGGKTGCYLRGDKVTRLTPRECARVMGFPEDFRLPAADTTAYKLIGNSVAIPVVTAIVKQILAVLQRTALREAA